MARIPGFTRSLISSSVEVHRRNDANSDAADPGSFTDYIQTISGSGSSTTPNFACTPAITLCAKAQSCGPVALP